MADSLSVSLSVDRSVVTSGIPVTVTATVTDTSSSPRAWTLTNDQLLAYPGDATQAGTFLSDAGASVSAGGSVQLTAGITFRAQPTPDDAQFNSVYSVGASFTTADGLTFSASSHPQVTAVPAAPPPVDVPGNGQCDFRSNLLSYMVAVI